MPTGFHSIDAVIILAYLALLIAIGVRFYGRQRSLEDFVKGGRKLGWIPIGLSLMAAVNSGIDYIQAPAIIYAIGVVYLAFIPAWIFVYPWVARISLPFYRRLDVYSAYEYLEQRFSVHIRCLGAGIFILWRVGWMATALYVPCLAIHVATGKAVPITLMVVVLGVVVTIYTMLGGMKAVIWTDLIQFCVMFGGLAATLATVARHVPGGVHHIWETASEAGKLRLTADIPEVANASFTESIHLYFTEELTFVGIIVYIGLARLSMYTCDQVAIQRFQTTRNVTEARHAMIINAVSDTVWMVLLALVGLGLYAYYVQVGYPEGMRNDNVLPYFMSVHFPVGLTGLVITAILAASLSSVDAAINATTSVVVVDFYDRLVHGRIRPAEDLTDDEQRAQIRVSRVINVCLGIAVILIGCNVPRLGELYQAANKILGAFFGPLFGIFVLGMFTRRAHSMGVFLGAVAGLITSCYFSFFSDLSWQWPSPMGICVTLVVGYLASLLISTTPASESPLTYRSVMSTPETRS